MDAGFPRRKDVIERSECVLLRPHGFGSKTKFEVRSN
ncbi:hypothetical protein MPC1_4230005 [Methylocella tundrae]|nr:hypothetical protein MPC1_4230005 [Methylocella tundrae]